MKKNALRLSAFIFALALTGVLSCSSGGTGGGCGTAATDTGTTTTSSSLSCGKGTHQVGGACVAN